MNFRTRTIIIVTVLLLLTNTQVFSQDEYKSPSKAFFYSILFPGVGEKYVDGKLGFAKYFLVNEAVMLGFAVGYEVYSDWLEEDYRAFAANHAGTDISGKSKDYFVTISRYTSIFIYNEFMRQDRSFNKVINETPENIWIWDTVENRRKFYNMRVDADNVQNRTTYFYSGLFLNHVISGIHAAIKAKRHNRGIDNNGGGLDFKMGFNPFNPRKFFRAAIDF
ncbi:MAG: hypothetical protein GY863_10890 [bacterium]|nr:hypothetical protein [bacterium]